MRGCHASLQSTFETAMCFKTWNLRNKTIPRLSRFCKSDALLSMHFTKKKYSLVGINALNCSITYYVFQQWHTLGSWSRLWVLGAGCIHVCKHPWAAHPAALGTAVPLHSWEFLHLESAGLLCLKEKKKNTLKKIFNIISKASKLSIWSKS